MQSSPQPEGRSGAANAPAPAPSAEGLSHGLTEEELRALIREDLRAFVRRPLQQCFAGGKSSRSPFLLDRLVYERS